MLQCLLPVTLLLGNEAQVVCCCSSCCHITTAECCISTLLIAGSCCVCVVLAAQLLCLLRIHLQGKGRRQWTIRDACTFNLLAEGMLQLSDVRLRLAKEHCTFSC